MKPSEYIKLAIKTENQHFKDISSRIDNERFIRLDHASKGMITEVGEFVDVLKKYEIYGKLYSRTDLVEELGDLMWYIALACDEIGISLEEVMERNIAKLKARYGEKFNEEGAINRNLEQERNILENKGLAIMCIHANEVPANCPCDSDCYCKAHTCAIHYRTAGASITSSCGIYATRFSYSIREVTCADCRIKM